MDRLASKSLLAADTTESHTRYRLLETIRQYAADRLAAVGETEEAKWRHAGAFLDLAEREPGFAVLSREQDNFRAALGWALSHDSDTGLRLARALGGFWEARASPLEGQAWLERALATGPPTRGCAPSYCGCSARLRYFGDLDRADAIVLAHAHPTYWHVSVYLLTDSLVKMQV